jgi:hypothetical protein
MSLSMVLLWGWFFWLWKTGRGFQWILPSPTAEAQVRRDKEQQLRHGHQRFVDDEGNN